MASEAQDFIEVDLSQEDRSVLDFWRIGPILSAALPLTGTVNRTVIIHSETGSYVLRVSSRERDRIEWEHRCIAYAADHSLPVCRPIPLPDGVTVMERDATFYALFPLASGQQLGREELHPGHAQAAGRCLAHIHAAFETLPTERARVKNLTVNVAEALLCIPRIKAAIAVLPTLTSVERAALEHLAGRRRCLERCQHQDASIQKRLASLPQMVLHGDYQETNLFFHQECVSGVIDWDQSGRAARGWEIVRALHLMLGLTPDLCHAFLRGYRSVLVLPSDEVEEAAFCYGILADSNLWVYASAYLDGNKRAKRFVEFSGFTSFAVKWERAGIA